MDNHFNTPAEVIDLSIKACENKTRLPLGKMILLGIMAGAFIPFGGATSSTAAHAVENVYWSSIFVTLLANKINLFCASTLAVSATLDTRAEGCCQVFTDGDELKNRFLFQAPSEWESLTSLCSGVKGMPLRDGCVLTSGSKS